MERTRVIVVPGGVLQGTVGRAISGPGVEVVGVLSTFAELPAFVREQGVDCVIAWLNEQSLPAELKEAHDIRPNIRIVGIVGDARDVFVYEIEPHEQNGGGLGVERLSQLIQSFRRAAPVAQRTEAER